jgi:flap endonuclease-1
MSDALIENMYLMLSLFKSHNIIPIFIFDGKPPVEKRDVLNQRYKDKVTAETKCKELYNQLENVNTNSERETILETIQTLKKKCVFLKRDDIQKVQTLITAYGYSYYVAAGEADELCALFVRYKKAWACLSEDMDMFVYGIPRVLRYISLLNRTVVLYDTYDILKSIDITIQNFIELCIMSGSDYTNVNYSKYIIYSRKVVILIV